MTPNSTTIAASARSHLSNVRPARISRADIVAGMAVVVLFALVTALRFAAYNPHDGLGLFFCIPIAVAAIRFGPYIGAACGLVAFVLFVAWAQSEPAPAGAVGYLSRIVVFLPLGAAVGYFARARSEIDLRSRRLFDLSADLMGTVDGSDRLISANRAWSTLFGVAPDQMIGMSVRSAIGGWPDEGTRSDFAFDGKVLRPDGATSWIEWSVRQEPHGDRRYIVGRDVTERRVRAEHIKRLLAELSTARDSERKAISADLHDFVLQNLLVALMHAEQLGDATGSHHAKDIDKLVREATSSIRRIIDGINPLTLEHARVSDAIVQAGSVIASDHGIDIQNDVEVELGLSPEHTLLAYRLTSEALRNAAKHAGVESVSVVGRDNGDRIEVEIVDAGHGFPEALRIVDTVSPVLGNGFNMLIEQVLGCGGHIEIHSVRSGGTSVRFTLPARTDPVRLSQ